MKERNNNIDNNNWYKKNGAKMRFKLASKDYYIQDRTKQVEENKII